MARDLRARSALYHIGLVRLGKCGQKDCSVKTRLALVIPVSDIEPDGTAGLAGIRLCGEHVADSIRKLEATA